MLQNRDEYDEDSFQCKYCTDLCYWSMIRCSEHTPSSQSSEPQNTIKEKKSGQTSRYTNKQEKRASQLSNQSESQQYCIHHLGYCGCEPQNYQIVYRYSTSELQELLVKIKNACRIPARKEGGKKFEETSEVIDLSSQ
jgi:hypothetical protein